MRIALTGVFADDQALAFSTDEASEARIDALIESESDEKQRQKQYAACR